MEVSIYRQSDTIYMGMMPQGSHNSLAIFHRVVVDVLKPFLGNKNVLLYVDDILISTGGTKEKHIELVDKVLQPLSKAGFKMNKAKTQIAKREIQYLGYIITQNHKALTEDGRKCIIESPCPHNLNALQKV